MPLKKNFCKGFTLTELMVVIVILGILSAIGVPSYRKYVINSKMAEAYQGIGVMIKFQTAHFNEFKEFRNIGRKMPEYLDPPMIITTLDNWTADRLPFPVNSNTFFSYGVAAGKTDSSGTELLVSPTTGNTFQTNAAPGNFNRASYTTNQRCNPVVPASTFGATIQPNYDWVLFGAVADLNGDKGNLCTAVIRLLQSSDGEVSSNTGFLVLNMGD